MQPTDLPPELQPDACPHCGGMRVRVVYGLPVRDAQAWLGPALQAGLLQTGGCVVDLTAPLQVCDGCARGVSWLGYAVSADATGNWRFDNPEDEAAAEAEMDRLLGASW